MLEKKKKKKEERDKTKGCERKMLQKSYEEELSRVRKKNEEKRLRLKQDLERQITFAKERRTKIKEESTKMESFVLFEPEISSTRNRNELEIKFKDDLLKQIEDRKLQKEKEAQLK